MICVDMGQDATRCNKMRRDATRSHETKQVIFHAFVVFMANVVIQRVIQNLIVLTFSVLKSPSSAPLISRYILRLGQAAQNQQYLRYPYCKMYLEIQFDEQMKGP